MNEGLDPLRQKRQRWVDANQENHFDEGIKRLLTELYPDNAHFIYELLQNAEDAGATTVQFTLASDELQFEHNGTRLFDMADVESITSIANSTKKDDPTSVGKFGVGFKAVFAYTTAPEIHSGKYQFCIRDLVVPDPSGVTRTALDEHNNTRFVFPFNHSTKKPAQAVMEIGNALRALDASSLMFLRHIRVIEYLLPDAAFGRIERSDIDGHTIEIRQHAPDGTDTATAWLRFAKDVTVPIEAGESKRCRVAVSYALVRKNDEKAGAARAVVPAEPGRVCIYFPAGKETSNLRFHLHAPFASTVARDSVRDCDENKLLRDAVADLVAESLDAIRDMGLLTVDFLGVLPNADDGLSEFYEPIRERIVQVFGEKPLLPTRSGGHAATNAVYRGPAKIAEVLDNDDFSMLTDGDARQWAANAPQQNQRPSRFLDSLDIDPWGWRELTFAVRDSFDEVGQPIVERLVPPKDDNWVRRFYALLGEAIESHDESVDVDDLHVVRVQKNNKTKHVLGRDAYFLPDGVSRPMADVQFVQSSVYENSRSKQQTQFAKSFLEAAGVRPFNEAEATKRLLAKYDGKLPVNVRQHCSDMRVFVDAWKRKIMSSDGFNGFRFILGTDGATDQLYWCRPRELAVDSPYVETGLYKLSGIHRKMCMSQAYADTLPNGLLEDFIQFLDESGVTRGLSVAKVRTDDNPLCRELRSDWFSSRVRWTSSAIDEDYSIDGIKKYIELQSQDASRLVWSALIRSDKRCAKARFRPNQQYQTREADSQIVQYLKGAPWIPDAMGNFHKPCDMTRDSLPDGFDYDDCNGMLAAIEFGKHAKEQDASYRARDESAKDLGFESAEDAEWLAELTRRPGMTREILEAFARSQATTPLPEAQVPRPDRRSGKVLASAAASPNRESVVRERKVDPSAQGVVLEARAYLRAKYTNNDGQLVCQCCRREMPFKVHGEYYFEAVQCLRGLGKHYVQNRLALCPTCAAMYQHARETSEQQISAEITNAELLDGAGSVAFQIRLAGSDHRLYFVGPHWFDFKTLLAENH